MDYLSKARQVIASEAQALQQLHDQLANEPLENAILLLERCVERNGKIIVIGVGKSGHIGEKIAATLTSTGAPAVKLNILNALHGDLGMVNPGDVILALSASGQTEELIDLLPLLLRLEVKLIAITGNKNSPLAKHSHVVLEVNIDREACPLNLAPTSSTTAMLALGDALAMVLMEIRGFTKEDFAQYHPGGRLGRRLWKVHQIMRPADKIALVQPTTPVSEALAKMTQHRTGAAIIVNTQGALEGIFTHGDFVRHYQKDQNGDLGTKPVEEVMTRHPISIMGDRLAVEILPVLEKTKIDDLLVVDQDRKPIGLVDTQDLAKLKLI